MNKEGNILVTGGSGFIGKYILKDLRKKKIKIYASYFKNKLKKNKYLKPIKIDLNQIKKKDIARYKIEKIIHLAWQNLENYHDVSHEKQILEKQKRFIELVVKNGCKNLIIAGTCYEYGLISGKISENTRCYPVCSYGSGKNSLRQYVLKLQKKFKFKLTWFRVFYIYGINPNKNTLTSILLKKNKIKTPIILNKKIERDYIDINYVSKIFVKILQKNRNYGIVNLSSGKKVSLKQLVKFLSQKYNIKPLVKFKNTKQRPFEPEIFYGDNSKLNKIMS